MAVGHFVSFLPLAQIKAFEKGCKKLVVQPTPV